MQPPRRVRPGARLEPPVVVRLDARAHAAAQAAPRAERLFAVLSVTDEAGSATLAPPRADLVRGNVAGSLQVLEGGAGEASAGGGGSAGSGGGGRREVGFLSFPDVAVREPGRYRLRVSLLAFSAPGAPGGGGSRGPVHEVLSDVVEVDERAGPARLGESSFPKGAESGRRD